MPDETDLRQRAEAGDAAAMTALGWSLERRGRIEEAETWYQRAADGGDATGMRHLWILLARFDKVIWAERARRSAAKAGDDYARRMVRGLDRPAAEKVYRAMAEPWHREQVERFLPAASVGDRHAMVALAEVSEGRGDTRDACDWYARAGEIPALNRLGQTHERAGRPVDARYCYERAAEAGDPAAMSSVARTVSATKRARAGGAVFLGVVLVAIGLWLSGPDPAPTFSPPTCNGETMGPGDECIVLRGSGSDISYDEELAEFQRERASWQGDQPFDDDLGWTLMIIGIGTTGYSAVRYVQHRAAARPKQDAG